MIAIPRAQVAHVLNVSPEALPLGDLPLDRLADRFLGYLRETYEQDMTGAHPEFWTFVLVSEVMAGDLDLAVALMQACLARAEDRQDLELMAAGPLQDLLDAQGEAALPALTQAALSSPRLQLALTGVTPSGSAGAPLWKAVTALAAQDDDLGQEGPLPKH